MTEPITLKKARLLREKSQESCAEALGVHVNTYRRLEEEPENLSIKQAKTISAFLGFDYDILFFAQ